MRDGVSNITDDNSEQCEKTQLPLVETEGGILKDFRLEQLENAD
jgi:hypothetical protein